METITHAHRIAHDQSSSDMHRLARCSRRMQAANSMSARSLAPFAIWCLLLISAYSPLAQCKRDDAQLVHQHGALRALYINTLKKSVTGILLETPAYQPGLSADTGQLPVVPFQLERRINGEDWPVQVLQGQTLYGHQLVHCWPVS